MNPPRPHLFRHASFLFILILWTAPAAMARAGEPPPPRKIVFLAGAPDGHAAGTHEYAKGVRLLEACLNSAPNVRGIRTEAHFGGWPEDQAALDDADTIVVYSTGANRGQHPLLQAGRLEYLGRLMARGVGLVCIHYTLYMPNDRGGPEFLDWVGGYNDYERNYSTHRVTTNDPPAAMPASAEHAISRGWTAFAVKNEFYIRQRFRERDERLVPILTTMLPVNAPTKQTVAWAVERKDGGRGFAFTGGHFHDNWRNENLRRMMLNAILWTAKIAVPEGGVQSRLPSPPPSAGALTLANVLPGWTTTGNWSVQADGAVTLEPRPGEKGWRRYGAYLWTKEKHGDFVLDLEYRIPKGGNSGVFVRVRDRDDPVQTGIEVQINDVSGQRGRLGPHDCGGIIGTIGPSKNMSKPAGQWNHMVITCRGGRMQVALNGEPIVDLQLDESAVKDRPRTGYIGLQDHGLPCAFRQVKIKPLPSR